MIKYAEWTGTALATKAGKEKRAKLAFIRKHMHSVILILQKRRYDRHPPWFAVISFGVSDQLTAESFGLNHGDVRQLIDRCLLHIFSCHVEMSSADVCLDSAISCQERKIRHHMQQITQSAKFIRPDRQGRGFLWTSTRYSIPNPSTAQPALHPVFASAVRGTP